MTQLLNIIAAVLIVPYCLIKLVLMIVMVIPEFVLCRYRPTPPVWWLNDAKNRNWLAQNNPVWYWYGVRNTLPWLRIPLQDVRYTNQVPEGVNIESIDLLKAGHTKGWRFTRYKYLLAEVECVRTRPDSYDEYRFGWAIVGDKMKITGQNRRGRSYGK